MKLWRVLLWLLAALGVGFVAIVVVFIVLFDAPGCREDSPSVALARGLTAERLSNLCARTQTLAGVEFDLTVTEYFPDSIPIELADLDAKIIRPHIGNIMLDGCFSVRVRRSPGGDGSAMAGVAALLDGRIPALARTPRPAVTAPAGAGGRTALAPSANPESTLVHVLLEAA